MKTRILSVGLLVGSLFVSCKESEDVVMPDSLLPEMTIGTITIGKDLEWSLTRSNKYVALSNYEEKTQYYLTWEGGMTAGDKKDGVMLVATNGSEPKETYLSGLNVENDGINCKIHFTTEAGKTGLFVFPLQ